MLADVVDRRADQRERAARQADAPDEEGLHPNLVAFLRQRKHLLGVLEDVKDDVTAGALDHTSQ